MYQKNGGDKQVKVTKRNLLLGWAKGRDWFYLSEVPLELIGMSRPSASSALIHLCEKGIMDFRIQGLKQYRVRDSFFKDLK